MAIDRKTSPSNPEELRPKASVLKKPLESEKILRMADMIDLTGLCRATINYKCGNELGRGDANFPRKLKIGKSAIGFRASETYAWMASLT